MRKEVKSIVVTSLVINTALAATKLAGGYLGHTTSLVSDGYNSLTDIIISVMLLFAIRYASKKPDKDHPYGHEKFEGIVSLLLGIFLVLTSFMIFYEGVSNLINYNSDNTYVAPATFTIYIVIASILLKIFVYFINARGYKKYKQVSLKAESYNHLGDIFATSASLVGIIFATLGYIYIDYIAAIIIGLFILKNAYDVIKESISFLVDEAPSKEEMKMIKDFIASIDGVLSIDELKARKHVNKVYVDVEISVDSKLSLLEAHEIAEDVHIKVEHKFLDVIHCMVHYNPKKD